MRLAGIRFVHTASRFVQNSTSGRPSTGGTAEEDPVAITRFSYSISRSPTATTPGRTTRASPRTSSAP